MLVVIMSKMVLIYCMNVVIQQHVCNLEKITCDPYRVEVIAAWFSKEMRPFVLIREIASVVPPSQRLILVVAGSGLLKEYPTTNKK